MPTVSVIIPVYNGQDFLAESIESALSQTWQDFELVIVDDGSSDRSGEIADRYSVENPGRIIVIHQENMGLVVARNVAIEKARGKLLALLDADDLWLPNHLAEAVSVMERDEEVGLVHSNFELMNERGDVLGCEHERWRPCERPDWERILLRTEHVGCPTAVFRRSMVDAVGGFDIMFNRLGCEDRDLWLRIVEKSRVVYLRSIHARYRLHGKNMSGQRAKMIRARLMLVDKHCPARVPRALRNMAAAAVHIEDAYELRRVGMFRESRMSYMRALRFLPFSLKIWRGTIAAILGVR